MFVDCVGGVTGGQSSGGAVILPLFVPGVIMGTALFMYFRSFMGFKLGYWSLGIGHFVWAFPFSLLAGAWGRFWHIEFPALRPGIIAAGHSGYRLDYSLGATSARRRAASRAGSRGSSGRPAISSAAAQTWGRCATMVVRPARL